MIKAKAIDATPTGIIDVKVLGSDRLSWFCEYDTASNKTQSTTDEVNIADGDINLLLIVWLITGLHIPN